MSERNDNPTQSDYVVMHPTFWREFIPLQAAPDNDLRMGADTEFRQWADRLLGALNTLFRRLPCQSDKIPGQQVCLSAFPC